MPDMTETWIEGAIFFVLWSFMMYRIGVRVGRGGREGTELSGPPPLTSRADAAAEISGDDRAAVEAALADGDKIEAIKRFREATGLGLKEAKEAVEAMERR